MRIGIGVVTLTVAFSFTGWARAQCTTDNDCKGDRVCEAGQCKQPTELPPSPPPPPAARENSVAPTAEPPTSAPLSEAPRSVEVSPAVRTWHRRSKGAMAGGIVLTSIGPLVALGGLAILFDAEGHCLQSIERGTEDDSYEDCLTEREALGYIVMGGGFGLVAGGIPLIIWGADKVPNEPQAEATLRPWLGPTGGGLSLRLSM